MGVALEGGVGQVRKILGLRRDGLMREGQDFLLGNLHQIGRGLRVVTTELDERLSELFDPTLEGSVLDDVSVILGM